MAKITITSAKQEQLDFIKRVREFLNAHTEEQLDALPKDKNGFIDFFTIFKEEDEAFDKNVVVQKNQFSKPTGKVNLNDFKKRIDEKFN
jgi:hypothetical protein